MQYREIHDIPKQYAENRSTKNCLNVVNPSRQLSYTITWIESRIRNATRTRFVLFFRAVNDKFTVNCGTRCHESKNARTLRRRAAGLVRRTRGARRRDAVPAQCRARQEKRAAGTVD